MKRLLSLLGVAAAVFLLLLSGSSLVFSSQGLGLEVGGFTQFKAVSHAMGSINDWLIPTFKTLKR